VSDQDARLDEQGPVHSDVKAELHEFDIRVREYTGEAGAIFLLCKRMLSLAAVATYGMAAQTFALARTAGELEDHVAVHGRDTGRVRE
jgi:hypothetical protein